MIFEEIITKTGVYKITNKINGKFYIGSAAESFSSRWKGHINKLNRQKHRNRYLQSAWNKYKEENFVFSILLVCESTDCLKYEQVFLDNLKPWDDNIGYNICKIAGSTLGVKFSDESKKKLSESKTGLKRTEEAKKRVSEGMMGRVVSSETRAKISAALTGKKLSQETRNKISEVQKGRASPRKGKPVSQKEKERLATLNIGRKASEETRKKISEGNRGRVISQDHRQKLSQFKDSVKMPYKGIDKLSNKVCIFLSGREAERHGFDPSKIRFCIDGKRKSHKGYTWLRPTTEEIEAEKALRSKITHQ